MLKRNLVYSLLIFLSGLMFISCNSDILIKEQVRFFDLKAYFDSEAKRLSKLNKVRKTTSIEGITETKELDQLDIEKELKIFAGSDINKVAWLDSYQVDSLIGANQQLQQLTYTALDDQLRTRSLKIYFSDSKLDSLFIKNETTTAIANSQQNIIYKPQSGYQIQSIQDINFASAHELGVQVEFLD